MYTLARLWAGHNAVYQPARPPVHPATVYAIIEILFRIVLMSIGTYLQRLLKSSIAAH